MKNYFLFSKFYIGVFLAISFLASCGSNPPPTGLTPNFSQNGYSAYVEQMALNTYKFTVVSNTNHKGAVFSVYGLADESQIGSFSTSTRMRLAHVADGHQAGNVFEVTFNSDDNVFIIYEDALVSGSFVFDTSKEIIRGQFRK